MTYSETQDGGCARKWYFDKVLGVARPADKALQDGSRFHTEIEKYLGGEITEGELSPTIRAGVHLMPAPLDPAILIEQPIDGVLDLGGVPFSGRADCINTRGTYIDAFGVLQYDTGAAVEVIDWKSTSNLKYAKRGADLIDNPQMIGYGEFARRKWPGVQFIRLSHVAFQKRGSFSAQKNTAVFSVDVVRDRWQSLLATVEQMKDTAGAKSVADVKPNYAACDKFKGCPYRSMCPRSPSAVLSDYFGNLGSNTMGLFKDKAAAANNTNTQPSEPARVLVMTNPPGVAVSANDAAIIKETAAILKEEAAAKNNASEHAAFYGNCALCGEPVTSANGSRAISGKIKHLGCKAGIVTADQKQPEGLPGQALDGTRAVAPSIQAAADNLGLGKPAEVAALANVPAVEQEQGKKPRKAREPKNTPAPSSEPAQASPGALPVIGGNFAHALLVNARIGKGGFMFYDANEIVADICADICKAANVDDLELSPKDSPLAFGGWRGALRVAVLESEAFSAPGVYQFMVNSDADRVALEALRRRFAVVIVGSV